MNDFHKTKTTASRFPPAGHKMCIRDRPKTYDNMPAAGGLVLGNLLGNVLARPEFIAYDNKPKPACVRFVERHGPVKVLWTARDEADRERVERENDLVIFEFYRPQVRFK